MHVILGATGQTGRRICTRLLDAGEPVRALGRNPGRLAALRGQGAEAVALEMTDVAAMTAAFAGVTSAYVMVAVSPASEDVQAEYSRIGDVFAAALTANRVSHVVAMSACGVHRADSPIPGTRDVEERLSAIEGLNIVHLRAGYFMENVFASIASIRAEGVCSTVIAPDVKLPMIATRDIAEVAADLMAKRDFAGSTTRELLGERDCAMNEFTPLIGRAIGKPDLAYAQVEPEAAVAALVAQGFSPVRAAYRIGIYTSFNAGRLAPEGPRSPANSTPTSVEAFATEVFAPVYSS